MKNKSSSGSGGVNLNGIANGLLSKFGLGGYTTNPPGRDQDGTWLPLGEPAGGSATVQQNGIFWGGGSVSAPASFAGGVQTSILIESPRQVLSQNAAPLFQRLTMKMLDGQIDVIGIAPGKAGVFSNAVGASCSALVGIGMYMAKFNPDTNLYGIQDPLGSSDVSRFDWIYLEARSIPFQLDSTQSFYYPVNSIVAPKIWDLTHPTFNQVLGPGEALMLAVNAKIGLGNLPTDAVGPSNPLVYLSPNIRGFLVRGS